MKYLSERYAKVFTYKEFDICTLKIACPADGDALGYWVDHNDFAGQLFNLVDDAIKAIDNVESQRLGGVGMKIEDVIEARNYFRGLIDRLGNGDADNKVCVTAAESLEKQIPRNTRYSYRDGTVMCDSCEAVIPAKYLYCPWCGQRPK